MIDSETKKAVNEAGKDLARKIGPFYGKIVLSFQDGYVGSTVEQSIRITEPLQKGAKK